MGTIILRLKCKFKKLSGTFKKSMTMSKIISKFLLNQPAIATIIHTEYQPLQYYQVQSMVHQQQERFAPTVLQGVAVSYESVIRK
jgi:hypothetical protein